MKAQLKIQVAYLAAAVLAGACGPSQAGNGTGAFQLGSLAPSPTPSGGIMVAPPNTGIKGSFFIQGTTCAVIIQPPGPSVHAYTSCTSADVTSCVLVKSAPTDAQGNFSLDVAPGTYTVTMDNIQTLTPVPQTGVAVTTGAYTAISIPVPCGGGRI